jgi:hypothetical protein
MSEVKPAARRIRPAPPSDSFTRSPRLPASRQHVTHYEKCDEGGINAPAAPEPCAPRIKSAAPTMAALWKNASSQMPAESLGLRARRPNIPANTKKPVVRQTSTQVNCGGADPTTSMPPANAATAPTQAMAISARPTRSCPGRQAAARGGKRQLPFVGRHDRLGSGRGSSTCTRGWLRCAPD